MFKILWPAMLAGTVIALSACGGDGDSDGTASFSGIWDVRYNLTVDECGVVTPGVIGFVDQHVIEERAEGVAFSSVDQLISVENGVIREDGSLFVEAVTSADLIGDGSLCDITTTVVYRNLVEDDAESLFTLRIECSGIAVCASEAIGGTKRQVVPS